MSTTSFQRIVQQAEETKRRKQENYEPLYGKVYRHNEKITSQLSSDKHQATIEDVGKVQDSLQTRATEHSGLKAAGGDGSVYDVPRPLVEVPNKYANLKRCACKEHVGDRWVNRSQFSADPRHVDGLQAHCKKCRAEKARFAYIPRWKRGV